jgi:hypothetical protein
VRILWRYPEYIDDLIGLKCQLVAIELRLSSISNFKSEDLTKKGDEDEGEASAAI